MPDRPDGERVRRPVRVFTVDESEPTRAQQRRLTTILAADVVNYSGLMSADEEATFRTLNAYRAIFEAMIERHSGRIFNTAGDSILAEFGSAVEAVRCAISIQDALQLQNAGREPARQMQFRIGVNIGDVLVEGDNLYGDGVNVAARLEALAEPGGICASASVYELVKGKVSFRFEDIGAQPVKNIPQPVRAYRMRARIEGEPETVEAVVSAPSPRRRRIQVAGGAVAVLLVAAVAAAWQAGVGPFDTSPPPPPGISTDQARRMAPYVGMTVFGRTLSHRPFTMKLSRDGSAVLAVERVPGVKPAPHKGRWTISENGAFCVKFGILNGGRLICRPVETRSGTVTAVSYRGAPMWLLRK